MSHRCFSLSSLYIHEGVLGSFKQGHICCYLTGSCSLLFVKDLFFRYLLIFIEILKVYKANTHMHALNVGLPNPVIK